MRSRSQPLPFLIPGDGEPAGSGASSGTRGGCLAGLQRNNPEDKLRLPGQDRGGPAGGDHARSKGPQSAGPRPFPDLTAARRRGAGGPNSPRPTPGETLLREPPLLGPSPGPVGASSRPRSRGLRARRKPAVQEGSRRTPRARQRRPHSPARPTPSALSDTAAAPLPPRSLWRRSSTVNADWPLGGVTRADALHGLAGPRCV